MFWVTIGSNTILHLTLISLFSVVVMDLTIGPMAAHTTQCPYFITYPNPEPPALTLADVLHPVLEPPFLAVGSSSTQWPLLEPFALAVSAASLPSFPQLVPFSSRL